MRATGLAETVEGRVKARFIWIDRTGLWDDIGD